MGEGPDAHRERGKRPGAFRTILTAQGTYLPEADSPRGCPDSTTIVSSFTVSSFFDIAKSLLSIPAFLASASQCMLCRALHVDHVTAC